MVIRVIRVFRLHIELIAISLSLVAGAARADTESGPGKIDFARQVLPILSNKCFVCHGPDQHDDTDLRLDSHDGAIADLGGYQAIDPAHPERSEILERIASLDAPMPPAEAEKQLTDQEQRLVRDWIRQGGQYAPHWAFVAPVKRPPRGVKTALGSQVIDAFIERGLRAQDIDFAPAANRRALARRAALVLTGLPPEPWQLAAFLADNTSTAYERLVEELLDDPRFGEHQARYWLDAVRYGDTHGLHLDNRRGIYPYRDWVVHALNANLPLDDFLTWQLAGDLLPEPTLEQRVATGFVRMNPTTSEGGAIPEEFQAKNNFDRTETLGTVLLGMSLTCARCHTHKYDPIPQTEYYRLLAFFNSTTESSMDGNAYMYGPVVRAPANQGAWRDWIALEASREALLEKVESAATSTEVLAHAVASQQWQSSRWRVTSPVATEADAPVDGAWMTAGDLPGTSATTLPGTDQAVWLEFDVSVPVDMALQLTFSGGADSDIWLDGEAIAAARHAQSDRLAERVLLAFSTGTHTVRVKLAGTKEKTSIQMELGNPWNALVKSGDWTAASEQDRLLMLTDSMGPLAELQLHDAACDLAQQIAAAQTRFATTLVAEDLPEPRTTKLLQRGEYHTPIGDPLQPGILTVMGAFPEGAPRNRLGLARWLTAREHPLTARVLVNRIWQRTFGHGLVRTPEDFGLQGEHPTHPELLDWLAVELHDSGWDLKHILRQMVTSRTFRQGSAMRANLDDPENRIWARGPRHRLDAEVLRDMALWASGLLDPHMGGEGIKPYQPGGMWSALAHPGSNTKLYVPDKGKLLYRRSLYVYWKRTSPHPMLTLFDAPSRESSCVQRSRTSTALQSLGLLNETQRIEMARALAERLLRERDDTQGRLDHLFGLIACRNPDDQEQNACKALLNTLHTRYADNQDNALALLSTGEALRNHELNPAEHAAWTQLVVTVLASDAAILLY
ncbi:MAG: PSD1 and planctomycete cytochrome C domain-containing protein [Pirellulales bacterium]|nr:PSD1 and planctomycete cytochrome C domain-containing protein [Pirellulales bacterium]